MMRVIAIIQPFMFQRVCEALRGIDDLPGLTVSDVIGWGKGRGVDASDVVHEHGCAFVKKKKVELVVPSALTDRVVEVIAQPAHTGNLGDGKIFVHELRAVMKIRTGERGERGI